MKVKITMPGIFGKHNEIPIGTEIEVDAEPTRWPGRYEIVSDPADQTPVTNPADGGAGGDPDGSSGGDPDGDPDGEPGVEIEVDVEVIVDPVVDPIVDIDAEIEIIVDPIIALSSTRGRPRKTRKAKK